MMLPAWTYKSAWDDEKENGMKRKEALGILAIDLTVLACHLSDHQFRAAVQKPI